MHKGCVSEEAPNDSELGYSSCTANPEPPTRFTARPAPRQAGFPKPGEGWGVRGPPALQLRSRARGSPTPWAWCNYSTRRAQANRTPELTRSGEGGSWRRKRQDLGQRAQGCMTALTPFPYTHRTAHAPAGAGRAELQPTRDPYRPRGARRKPRSIRAFVRAREHARVQDPPPPPTGAGAWPRPPPPRGRSGNLARAATARAAAGGRVEGCLARATGHPGCDRGCRRLV